MSTPKTYISVAVWQTDQAYLTSSTNVLLSCNHKRLEEQQMTVRLQVLPQPGATIPISEIENDTDSQSGTAYPSLHVQPQTFPADGTVKNVTKVVDMDTNMTYYVDTESYDANIAKCNPAPYVTSCATVTDLTAGSITTTGATLTFTGVPGASGYEWINKTANVTPVINGTFDAGSPIVLTGLTTGTAYYFFIKTICIGGLASSWTSVTFTTS